MKLDPTRKRTEDAMRAIDQQDPRILLKSRNSSFIMMPEAFLEARLEPAAMCQAHGEQYGRLKVRAQDGRSTTYQFETPEDMDRAVELLPVVFGKKLIVNVEWSERSKQYAKKKA